MFSGLETKAEFTLVNVLCVPHFSPFLFLRNTPKFRFDPEFEGHRFVSHWLLSATLVKQSQFIYFIYFYWCSPQYVHSLFFVPFSTDVLLTCVLWYILIHTFRYHCCILYVCCFAMFVFVFVLFTSIIVVHTISQWAFAN